MNTAIVKAALLVVFAIIGGYFLLCSIQAYLGITVPALQALYGGSIVISLINLRQRVFFA